MSRILNLLRQHAEGLLSRQDVLRGLLVDKVMVILDGTDPSSHTVRFQDYFHEGKAFFPLFSDGPTATELLKDVRLPEGMGLWSFDAPLLFHTVPEDRWFILNAGSALAFDFLASDIKPFLTPPPFLATPDI